MKGKPGPTLKQPNANSNVASSDVQATIANNGNIQTAQSKSGLVTLKDNTPNQAGKGYKLAAYNTLISNGKISVPGRQTTTGTFDFVVTNDGRLMIGSGHHTLSGGAETVQAAGRIKISNGQVKSITNESGHYKPTMSQAEESVKLLDKLGVNTSGANISIYNADGSLNKSYRNN